MTESIANSSDPGYDPSQDPDADPEMLEQSGPADQGESQRDPAEGPVPDDESS